MAMVRPDRQKSPAPCVRAHVWCPSFGPHLLMLLLLLLPLLLAARIASCRCAPAWQSRIEAERIAICPRVSARIHVSGHRIVSFTSIAPVT